MQAGSVFDCFFNLGGRNLCFFGKLVTLPGRRDCPHVHGDAMPPNAARAPKHNCGRRPNTPSRSILLVAQLILPG